MCGIAGAVRFGRPLEGAAERVGAMLDAIRHRGPDADGVQPIPDGALGSVRLAIVDLEGGVQPMWDAAREICLVFNGEIYNHEPLRKEMSARGSPFETRSDTEVAARLFAELPPANALDRLDGQFAIAAWSPREQRLVLARDRLGQKPLYWTQLDDGTLVFASELKGVLSWPGVPRRVDPRGLDALLLQEFVPAPRTIYAGIQKLEPGTMLVADARGVRIERWWSPPSMGGAPGTVGEAKWAAGVLGALQVATMRRMLVSDVPVAYLLSGGIDSSAVAAMAASKSDAPLQTFSVVFDEPSFDESGPAALMARHIGSEHTEIRFQSGRLPEVLAALERGICEPLSDGSLPSTWVLADAVRGAGFKVALSGDGADEHFGGYPSYLAHRLAGPARPAGRLIRRVAGRIPASTRNMGAGFLAERFAAGLPHPLPRRNAIWLGCFLPDEIEALLGRPADPWEAVDRWGREAAGPRDPALQAMFMDQRLYLSEGVLAKVDRASMLRSLEIRSPFLDHQMAALASHLPRGSWIRGRQTKVLLRRAVAGLLPPALLERPKKGFGTPLAAWLKGPCSGLLDDLPERLEGAVQPEPVRRWIREHRAGQADHRKRLWPLLMLGRWWRGPWGPG